MVSIIISIAILVVIIIMTNTIAVLFFSECSDCSNHNNGNLALNRLVFMITVLIVWYPIQEEKGQYSLMRVHVVRKTSHQEISHLIIVV